MGLGAKRAVVVCAADGMDEISRTGLTHFGEVCDGQVLCYSRLPDELGFSTLGEPPAAPGNPQQAAELIRQIFSGNNPSDREWVCLNAGVALWVCDRVATVEEGVNAANQAIVSGKAAATLQSVIAFSKSLRS